MGDTEDSDMVARTRRETIDSRTDGAAPEVARAGVLDLATGLGSIRRAALALPP